MRKEVASTTEAVTAFLNERNIVILNAANPWADVFQHNDVAIHLNELFNRRNVCPNPLELSGSDGLCWLMRALNQAASKNSTLQLTNIITITLKLINHYDASDFSLFMKELSEVRTLNEPEVRIVNDNESDVSSVNESEILTVNAFEMQTAFYWLVTASQHARMMANPFIPVPITQIIRALTERCQSRDTIAHLIIELNKSAKTFNWLMAVMSDIVIRYDHDYVSDIFKAISMEMSNSDAVLLIERISRRSDRNEHVNINGFYWLTATLYHAISHDEHDVAIKLIGIINLLISQYDMGSRDASGAALTTFTSELFKKITTGEYAGKSGIHWLVNAMQKSCERGVPACVELTHLFFDILSTQFKENSVFAQEIFALQEMWRIPLKDHLSRFSLQRLQDEACSTTALGFLIDGQITRQKYVELLIGKNVVIPLKTSVQQYLSEPVLERLKTTVHGSTVLSLMIDDEIADRQYVDSRILNEQRNEVRIFFDRFFENPNEYNSAMEQDFFRIIAVLYYDVVRNGVQVRIREKEIISLAKKISKNGHADEVTADKIADIQYPVIGADEMAVELDFCLGELNLSQHSFHRKLISRLIGIKDTVLRADAAINNLLSTRQQLLFAAFMPVTGKLSVLVNFLIQLLSKIGSIQQDSQLQNEDLGDDSRSVYRDKIPVDIVCFAKSITNNVAYAPGTPVPPLPSKEDWKKLIEAINFQYYKIRYANDPEFRLSENQTKMESLRGDLHNYITMKSNVMVAFERDKVKEVGAKLLRRQLENLDDVDTVDKALAQIEKVVLDGSKLFFARYTPQFFVSRSQKKESELEGYYRRAQVLLKIISADHRKTNVLERRV